MLTLQETGPSLPRVCSLSLSDDLTVTQHSEQAVAVDGEPKAKAKAKGKAKSEGQVKGKRQSQEQIKGEDSEVQSPESHQENEGAGP